VNTANNFLEYIRLKHGISKSRFGRILGWSRQRYQAAAKREGLLLSPEAMEKLMDNLGYGVGEWTMEIRAFYVPFLKSLRKRANAVKSNFPKP